MNYFDNSLILCGLCEKPLRALRLKHVFALLAGVVFISVNSFAQLDTAIVRTFGGPYYEEGRQIIECAEGGYAIIGTTGSDQLNNTNFYLLRLDEELNCLWSQNYGGAEVEWGYSIVEDANNNLLVCGYTNSFGEGGYDILAYKVDPLGNVLWQKTYGGSDWDFAYKMIAHPEEGYLICGKTYSYGNGGSDAYLLHISEDGNLINEWTYGGEGDDEFRDLTHFNQRLHCLKNTVDASSEILLMPSVGLVDQTVSFNETQTIVINSLSFGNDHLYGCGHWRNETNFYNFYMISLNSNYDIEWYELGPNEYQYDLRKTAVGLNELIYVGNTDSFGYGESEIMFQRRLFDSYWTAGPTFGTDQNDVVHDLIIDSSQRPIAIGVSNGYNNNHTNELLLLRLQDSDLTFEYEEIEDLQLGCFTVNTSTIDQAEKPIFRFGSNTIKIENYSLGEYCLYNNTGQLVMHGNQNQIDVSRLGTGMYLINLKSKNKIDTYSKKIILIP